MADPNCKQCDGRGEYLYVFPRPGSPDGNQMCRCPCDESPLESAIRKVERQLIVHGLLGGEPIEPSPPEDLPALSLLREQVKGMLEYYDKTATLTPADIEAMRHCYNRIELDRKRRERGAS